MRSRHHVLQDSISQVRPLLKKAWHWEARSATSASPRRGAIVLRRRCGATCSCAPPTRPPARSRAASLAGAAGCHLRTSRRLSTTRDTRKIQRAGNWLASCKTLASSSFFRAVGLRGRKLHRRTLRVRPRTYIGAQRNGQPSSRPLAADSASGHTHDDLAVVAARPSLRHRWCYCASAAAKAH